MTSVSIALASTVVVVSGFPRSGTSLMMAMLSAGGVPALTDGARSADPDNPKGYFELEAVKRLRTDAEWLPAALGRAVKIVVPLVLHLPRGFSYRILFMERDWDELVASQAAMLHRKGLQLALPVSRLKAILKDRSDHAKDILAGRSDCNVMTVSHAQALRDPGGVAGRVVAFLGGSLDITAMIAVLDPRLYRQRNPCV